MHGAVFNDVITEASLHAQYWVAILGWHNLQKNKLTNVAVMETCEWNY